MNEVNFLPSSYARQCRARSRRLRHIGLIVAVAVLMGGWLLIDAARLVSLEQYALTIENQATLVATKAQQAADLDRQRAVLAREVAVQRQLAAPVTFTQITTAVGTVLPDAATITDMALNGRRPLPDAIAAAAKTTSKPAIKGLRRDADVVAVSIRGLAPNDGEVANFVGSLSQHGLFTDVKLLYSKPLQIGTLIGREFRIDMSVPLERQFKPGDARPASDPLVARGVGRGSPTGQEVSHAH